MIDRIGDERGVGLVELMASMAMSALIAALLITWAITGLRSDGWQNDAQGSLDELRVARSRMIRELRFADELITADGASGPHRVTVWIDRPDAGSVGEVDTGVGEIVSWEITSSGTLTRSSDDPDDETANVASALLYDPGASEGSSSFAYPEPSVVRVVLVAQSGDGPEPQTIETSVRLRNA